MTSDERREVAEILRMSAKETNGTRDFAMYLSHWVGLEGITDDKGNPFTIAANRREAELTLKKLADLIDPTCHIVRVDDTYNTPETGRVDEWHYKCSKCGIELDDNDTDAMDSGVKPFDYCPNCGARITSGGDS